MSAAASPRWFPHCYDPARDAILFVERQEADFRAASFLDDRSLPPGAPRHAAPWAQVAATLSATARRDVQYIFHIGHVGSTLISRLLGELPQVLALREPILLRDVAERLAERDAPAPLWDPASIPARLDMVAALLSRTFRPDQRAMVKASSFVSEIAADLVPAGSKALLLYAGPERYMETILAGENSRIRHSQEAAGRLHRLHRRSGGHRWNLAGMGEGAQIAMAWAAEMTSLAQAEERLPHGATMWMDFDSFLAAPAKSLSALAGFFGIALGTDEADRLAHHPLMGRYSKATDYEFGPAQRAALLAEVRRDHGEAIAGGLAWLEEAGRAFPAVAHCLEVAGATTEREGS